MLTANFNSFTLAFLIPNSFVDRIGWMLVHSLWQFALLALIAFTIMRLMQQSSATGRYAVLLTALLLMVVAPVMTWSVLPVDAIADVVMISRTTPLEVVPPESSEDVGILAAESFDSSEASHAATTAAQSPTAASEPLSAEVVNPTWWMMVAERMRPWLSGIVWLWCAGVLLFSMRPLLSWYTVHRLRTRGISPVDTAVQTVLDQLRQRLGRSRSVKVLQSTLVHTPIVVGCFKSVILLPVSLVTGLPVSQLEAILAHELAHVGRYDYVVNLIQTLIETMFFYHPAVWWLSQRIRAERENCCDDLVVSALGNRIEYGRALLAIEESRGTASVLALGARGGSLLARVRRLFAVDPSEGQRATAGLAGLGMIFACLVGVILWSMMSANADADTSPDKEEFVARISDTMSVELLAVMPHGGESETAWRADGGTFDSSTELPEWPKGYSAKGIGDELRDFVFKFSGLDPRQSVTWRMPNRWTAPNRDENGVTRIAGEVIDADRPFPLRIGITDVEWGPFLTVDRQGNLVESEQEISAACREVYEQIKPAIVKPQGRHELFCWADLKSMDERAQTEVVAIDSDGERHKPYGSSVWTSANGNFSAEVFDVPIGHIDHFEYRLRPFRHWVTFENVSLQAGKKTKVEVKVQTVKPPEQDGFGVESHGLRCRLVALSPDASDESPETSQSVQGFTRSDDMTFAVELKNVSDHPVSLAGVRYGEGYAKETAGNLNTALLAPHLFEFEFTDANGKPVSRTQRTYFEGWLVLRGASVHELPPGESLTVLLRPARFNVPMDYDLLPGTYTAKVLYRGPNDSFRDNVRMTWPNQKLLRTWPYQVTSNTVDFSISDATRRAKEDDLVWGRVQDGLQAATECRVVDTVTGNPAISPGVAIGTSLSVVFHVRNASSKQITFVSETGRQGDSVLVTDEDGQIVKVNETFFSGEPIDVAWTLQPGDVAQLHVLAPAINGLRQPGRYSVRHTIRFNSRQQKDDKGDVIFPRPGDYALELETGDTPLYLRSDSQASSAGAETDISPNGEIRGQLLDEADKPVAGTAVSCGAIINDSGKGGGARTVTDADGRYRLAVPSPGIYVVLLKEYAPDPEMTAAADEGVRVEAGKVAESRLRLVRGRQVTGKAVDVDGKPFSDLTVMCYSAARPHSLGTVQSTKTAADGTFELFLPPGPARIYANEPKPQTDDNPFGSGRSGHMDVEVPNSSDALNVTLTLINEKSEFGSDEWLARSTPGTQIIRHEGGDDVTGSVVDSVGNPIAGVHVFKYKSPFVETSDKGEFRVKTDRGSQFIMHAFHPGYKIWFGAPTSGDELKIVLVKKPESADISQNLTDDPSCRVVDMQGQPIAGAQLEFSKAMRYSWQEKPPVLGTAIADDHGRFNYPEGLPDSDAFYAYVTAEGFLERFWRANGKVFRKVDGLRQPDTLVLYRPVTVTGKIIGEDGLPLADAEIAVDYFFEDGPAHINGNRVKSDADGRFTAIGVPPANVFVRYETNYMTVEERMPIGTQPGKLCIVHRKAEDGQTIDDIVLDLRKCNCVVEGRIIDQDKKGIAGRWIRATFAAAKGRLDESITAKSDDQGRFRFTGLSADEFVVGTETPGFTQTVAATANQPSEVLLTTYVAGHKSPPGNTDATVWGEPNEKGLVAGLRFTPEQETYAMGDVVRVEFAIRNPGTEVQMFSMSFAEHGELNVLDPTGNSLAALNYGNFTGRPFEAHYRLEPDHEAVVGSFQTGLAARGDVKTTAPSATFQVSCDEGETLTLQGNLSASVFGRSRTDAGDSDNPGFTTGRREIQIVNAAREP